MTETQKPRRTLAQRNARRRPAQKRTVAARPQQRPTEAEVDAAVAVQRQAATGTMIAADGRRITEADVRKAQRIMARYTA